MEQVKLLQSQKMYNTLLQEKEEMLGEIDYFIDGLGHRKVICEWLGHCCIEEKNQMRRYEDLTDVDDFEEAEKITQQINST